MKFRQENLKQDFIQVGHPCGMTLQEIFIHPKTKEVVIACPRCKKATPLEHLIKKGKHE